MENAGYITYRLFWWYIIDAIDIDTGYFRLRVCERDIARFTIMYRRIRIQHILGGRTHTLSFCENYNHHALPLIIMCHNQIEPVIVITQYSLAYMAKRRIIA